MYLCYGNLCWSGELECQLRGRILPWGNFLRSLAQNSSIIKAVSSSAWENVSCFKNNLLQFWNASIGRIKTSYFVRRMRIIRWESIRAKSNAGAGAIGVWGKSFNFVYKIFHCVSNEWLDTTLVWFGNTMKQRGLELYFVSYKGNSMLTL
jgi:hypothetical protein